MSEREASQANPYPGLRPFETKDSHLFFGRDEQCVELLHRLRVNRFLAVVGTSGSGKSSLVKAGLLPMLHGGFMVGGSAAWKIATMRPGSNPIGELADALNNDTVFGVATDDQTISPNLFTEATLRRGPLGLIEVTKLENLAPGENLLLLVDQFEEIFRFSEITGHGDEAAAFVKLLIEATKQSTLPIYIIVTMRSEFLGDCSRFRDLPETINDAQYLVPRLTREQLREAIIGPAMVGEGEMTHRLVQHLLAEIGDDPDQLPLLQHVLMRTWENAEKTTENRTTIDIAQYEESGGIREALSRHADEAFAELATEQQRNIAKIMFQRLSERGVENRDTRRPESLNIIAKVAEVPPEQVMKIVEVFRRPKRSFMTPPVETQLTSGTILDISHESLIRQWARMHAWVREEAESASTYRRLEETARLWKNKKADPWGKTVELDNALDWKSSQNPKTAWAERYGNNFETTMQFLEASVHERNVQEEAALSARKRELKLKQAKKQRTMVSLGLIVTIALASWALLEQGQVKALQKEKQFESYLTRASMMARSENYVAAKNLLTESYKENNEDLSWYQSVINPSKWFINNEILTNLRHVHKLLTWFTDLNVGTPGYTYELKKENVADGTNIKYLEEEMPLEDVAVSQNGRYLATVGEEGLISLLDRVSGKILNQWFHIKNSPTCPDPIHKTNKNRMVRRVVFHPENKWMATADDTIILWSLPTEKNLGSGKRLDEWCLPTVVRSDTVRAGTTWAMDITSDGQILASGGIDNDITLRATGTGKPETKLNGHKELVSDLAFNLEGNLLASASYDKTARIWDLKTRKTRHILLGHADTVEGVVFHPNRQMLATSSADNDVRLWDISTGRLLHVLRGHKSNVQDLLFVKVNRQENPDYRLVSSSRDGTLRLWDIDSGVTLKVLQGHTDGVFGLIKDGLSVFSASNDGTVRRWDLRQDESGRGRQVIDLPGKPHSTAISPNGSKIAVGFESGALRVYSLPDARLLIWQKENAHEKAITRLEFSPDSTYVASSSLDSNVKVWHADEGDCYITFSGHKRSVEAIAFAPDSQTLASAGGDGQVGLFELGKKNGRFFMPSQDKVRSVAFDAKGQHLLTVSNDVGIQIWDMGMNTEKSPWPPTKLKDFSAREEEELTWASFSHDGSLVGSVGRNPILRIFKVKKNVPEPERLLHGHDQTIRRLAFSPNGGQVATVSADASVRLWDLYAGTELFALRLPGKAWPPNNPLWDFDFRCLKSSSFKNKCWIAVPMTHGQLVLYHLGQIYD